jgi:hypothetical protein
MKIVKPIRVFDCEVCGKRVVDRMVKTEVGNRHILAQCFDCALVELADEEV